MTTPASPSTRGTPPTPRHPLLDLLLDAADGRFPEPDGSVTVLGPPAPGLACSVAFTGHAVVATDRPAHEVRARRPDGFGGSLAPDFLRWLAGPWGRTGVIDVVLVARGAGGPARLPPRTDLADHPRVRLAEELRTGVQVFGDERGLVTLADGLAGRRELSIETVQSQSQSQSQSQPQPAGTGRALLADALTLVPAGEPVFAGVSPGNARSLRAFLATGFVPLGSEVILQPAR